MSSNTSSIEGHEKYYVPESSSLAVRATIGLVTSVFGAGLVLNDMTYGAAGESSNSVWVLTAGLVFFVLTLFSWFRTAIRENLAGMNSGQLHQSYVLGMFWFIFSEVMFFAAFFGALLYVRQFVGPWLAGEGDGGRFVVYLPDPARVERGPSFAPRVARALAWADREQSLGIGPLEPAAAMR